MEEKYKLTRQQAEEEMRQFREVFTVVRLLKPDEIGKMTEVSDQEHKIADELCKCYSFWGNQQVCENCTSEVAFREKTQKTKWEFMDEDIYQVISRYVEIDGVPQVMELVKKLDDDCLLDADGREKLIGKMIRYDDKLYRDVLTGAYNRRYFEDRVKNVPMKAGVAIIDIDDFKLCNDTFGHEAGDVALQTLVHTIRKYIRKADMIIRYGGDEFLLIMPDVNEEVFVEKLQKIQQKIHSVHMSQYGQMQLSISVGGVMMGDESVEQAVRRADKLMYQAKTQKNMVVTEEDAIDGDHRIERSKIKQQLLIVDDSEINREILAEMLKDDYRILQASNGEEGISMLQEHENDIALVLLDILMPGMNGFDTIAAIRENKETADIPVIFLTADDDSNTEKKGLEAGAMDFIKKPFVPEVLLLRVRHTIELIRLQTNLAYEVEKKTQEVTAQHEKLEKISRQIATTLSGAIDAKDTYTNGHSTRVAEYSREISRRAGFSEEVQDEIYMMGLLHDVGKIGIPDAIINKPAKLTDEEYSIIQKHPVTGAKILKNITEFPKLSTGARWHHERYDGKGYPDGIAGEEIPTEARIIAVADAYDAMSSRRSYRDVLPQAKVREEVEKGKGTQFDPVFAEIMLSMIDEDRDYQMREK